MKRIAAVLALVLLAAPLYAQRSRGIGRGAARGGSAGATMLSPLLDTRQLQSHRSPVTRGPIPFPPVQKPWMRIDSTHFVFLSNAGERRTRGIVNDFESLAALLKRTSTHFRPPARRTRVFVFDDRRDIQPYFNASYGIAVDANGITVRHPDGGTTMLIDASSRGGSTLTPRHELVHDLLRHPSRPVPLWIEEGLAEYYSNAGLPIREHVTLLRGPYRISLRDLFAMQPSDPRSRWYEFYAESWAAVATLMRTNTPAFFALLDELEKGGDVVEALRKHFSMSTMKLEGAMRRAGAPLTTLSVTQFEAPMEISVAERSEVLYELAELLARVPNQEDEADRHFRASIDARPQKTVVFIRYAEFLIHHGRTGEARATAEQALLRGADESRAHAVIALSLAGEKRGDAVPYLECARHAMPDRADLTLALYSLYMDSGERMHADSLFHELTLSPKVNDARKILLDADLARADALARDGKIGAAAQILRDLATKMPGTTRVQLETQAAGLEKLALGSSQ